MLFYLPLLEHASSTEEDDEEFLQDSPETQHVDLIVPFQKSVKQIVHEVSLLPLIFNQISVGALPSLLVLH